MRQGHTLEEGYPDDFGMFRAVCWSRGLLSGRWGACGAAARPGRASAQLGGRDGHVAGDDEDLGAAVDAWFAQVRELGA